MANKVSTVGLSESEGWKLACSGIGSIQVQGSKPIKVLVASALPTVDDGAKYKNPMEEVDNNESTSNIYIKTVGSESCVVAVWKLV